MTLTLFENDTLDPKWHMEDLFARLLGVSISTIQCQRRELYLDDKLESFSDISDNELDSL